MPYERMRTGLRATPPSSMAPSAMRSGSPASRRWVLRRPADDRTGRVGFEAPDVRDGIGRNLKRILVEYDEVVPACLPLRDPLPVSSKQRGEARYQPPDMAPASGSASA